MVPVRCAGVSKRFLSTSSAEHLRRLLPGRRRSEDNWIHALDRIDLEIATPGKRIGIIGSNGSGKTTLLRIIAGVTQPTRGTIIVHGRVAPLLEPVSGLQPELTGRENIYLIGVILGMRRHEVRQKFDDIVEFAGISRLLDAPLKHYSLGMIMRLGFSVALHVDADIVLVDEAWSIGDAEFKTKSLQRLHELHKKKATLILVSHELELIQQETDEALWLDQGRMAGFGPSRTVAASYLQSVRSKLTGSAQ